MDKVPEGYLNIIIQIDENIINTCQNNILKCNNCLIKNGKYNCDKHNKFHFYPGINGTYYFYFQINSINELNSNIFNSTFYTLAQKNYSLSLYYKENELELINFNTTDNFYIEDNRSLSVNYSNYYFKINSINQFNGILKGLNLSN